MPKDVISKKNSHLLFVKNLMIFIFLLFITSIRHRFPNNELINKKYSKLKNYFVLDLKKLRAGPV